MREKEIINDFNNLIAKNIAVNQLKENSKIVKFEKHFIKELATDSRLEFNITRDISIIQDDLIYTTGILFTLRPYINNALNESINYMGQPRVTYFQNMFDSLYLMYASFCFEKLYNFWDRIGDKIANEFPDDFKDPKSIMFANVIQKIRNTKFDDNNIKWLIDFKDTEFKDFNEKRKIVVHYEQIESKYKKLFLDNINDKQIIENNWIEKSTLPEFFKKHIEMTNEGIKNTYEFVVNNKGGIRTQ